jgi:DNA-binding GntR family transcriptional regulator
MARTLNNSALPYHQLGYIQYNGKALSQRGHKNILAACRARREGAAVEALLDRLRLSASLVIPTCKAIRIRDLCPDCPPTIGFSTT